MLIKLSKINKRFKTFTLEKSIKCESQRKKREKIYRIIKKKINNVYKHFVTYLILSRD